MAREFAKKLYKSKQWLRTRESVLKRDNFLCVKCGDPAEEVHHIEHLSPVNIDNPDIALGKDNLISLCRDCHFDIHRESIRQYTIKMNKARGEPLVNIGYTFDEYGQMIEINQNIYIVYGSPGSGKTTYVKEHMQPGDMIVDLDMIKQAISFQGKTQATDNLLNVSIAVRDFLYDMIEANQVEAKNIWIVAGLPNKKQRVELMERLNAELIHIDTDIQECIRRAMSDNDRQDKSRQIEVINKWWQLYER